jgi:hypothetical protein
VADEIRVGVALGDRVWVGEGVMDGESVILGVETALVTAGVTVPSSIRVERLHAVTDTLNSHPRISQTNILLDILQYQ